MIAAIGAPAYTVVSRLQFAIMTPRQECLTWSDSRTAAGWRCCLTGDLLGVVPSYSNRCRWRRPCPKLKPVLVASVEELLYRARWQYTCCGWMLAVKNSMEQRLSHRSAGWAATALPWPNLSALYGINGRRKGRASGLALKIQGPRSLVNIGSERRRIIPDEPLSIATVRGVAAILPGLAATKAGECRLRNAQPCKQEDCAVPRTTRISGTFSCNNEHIAQAPA
jgi:hypothetical protein